ncbi:DUF748 domain-containing protein [Rivibacter subsaxonicus]|uniref:DUF748 domain-containing protein n=1 Tax=Rivibacter subsaxonicus TaxID=457575 RepID=UPI0013EEB9FA|nr:DUF748 domain-containing protein [Rivibacter subsaxonicus]
MQRPLLIGVLVLAMLALAWTLVVGLWLPGWLKPRVEAEATQVLGAPVAIEMLEIAPWSLVGKVGGLRVGPPAQPWLQVRQIEANLSIASLFRLAPVVERLSVLEPRVELVREAPGRFNISPMLDALAKRPPRPPEAEPARFSVNNIRVERGNAHLVDRVGKSEHRVDAIELGIPFISNLPSKVRIDVEPELQASVNGSPLRLKGKTQPFDEGQRSTIDLDWRDVNMPFWAEAIGPLLPQPLPLKVDHGKLALQLQIAFERVAPPAAPRLHVTGSAGVSQWRSKLEAQGLTLAFANLDLEDLDLWLLRRQARIGKVRLKAPEAGADLERLIAAKPVTPSTSARSAAVDSPFLRVNAAAPAASAAGGAPAAGDWAWQVGHIAVEDGRVTLRHPAWPQGQQQLSAVGLQLEGLDGGAQAAPARLDASLVDAHGAALKVQGELRPASRQASLNTELTAFDPRPWLVPLQAKLPVDWLDGKLGAGARIEIDAAARSVQLREGRAELLKLHLQPRGERGRDADRLLLPRLAVGGLEVDIAPDAPPALRAETLELERLALRASRDEGGELAWLKGLPMAPRSAQVGAAVPPAAPQQSETGAVRKPSLHLTTLSCGACSVTLVDHAVKPAATLALERVALKLGNLGNELDQHISFEVSSVAQRNGRVKLVGRLRPQPLELRSKIDVANLDLRWLEPYLEHVLRVGISSARAGAVGDLSVDGNVDQRVSALHWRGRASLAEVLTLDSLNDDAELLRFKLLRFDGLDVAWKPALLQADLGRIALEDFSTRVIINPNGTINLRELTKAEADRLAEAAAASAPSAASAPDAASAPAPAASVAEPVAVARSDGPARPKPQLRWQSIELKRGNIDFTDNFIRPNFSAQLNNVSGTVSAVAWNDPQAATVELTGKVDGSAPLTIGGTLHPLGPQLATDIRAEARGVELSRLSAYSARYAGYGIEKGTLSVKLHYKVEDGKLAAENNLYLDQLTFGAKVDSPSALKLPVLLAVSLLKDANGVIDIDLPISGTIDDPKFSLGGIIWKVIVNLFTKAVTAPFSLLAGGKGGEELGYVEFAPGSSEVDAEATRRLDILAKAMNDRPAVKLEATGRADPTLDEAALRERHIDGLMRTQKARSAGQLVESVKIEPAEREQWLAAAYKATNFKAKPRNLVGFQKSIPGPEMESLLRANAPVGAEQYKALADERANRVKAYLTDKVPAERVLLTSSKLDAEGLKDSGKTTRVAFALK